LQRRLGSPELSVVTRFRLLLEAYQVEQDYGSQIEAWRGPLTWRGEELSVQYLRVGRVAFYFQTLDGRSAATGTGKAATGKYSLRPLYYEAWQARSQECRQAASARSVP